MILLGVLLAGSLAYTFYNNGEHKKVTDAIEAEKSDLDIKHHDKLLMLDREEILKINGVTPHIYGKKETRPFRKMGHITIVNKDLGTARDIAEHVKETIEVITK